MPKRPLSMYSKKHKSQKQLREPPINYDDVVNHNVTDVSDSDDDYEQDDVKNGQTGTETEEQTVARATSKTTTTTTTTTKQGTQGENEDTVRCEHLARFAFGDLNRGIHLQLHDLKIGDIVYLESKARPGFFIKAMDGSNMVHLSKTDPGKFEIAAPELRHLVKLSGTR